jgi:hypothetical protein
MRFQTVVGGVICQTAHPLNAGFGETHKIMTVPVRSGQLKGAEYPIQIGRIPSLSALRFQLSVRARRAGNFSRSNHLAFNPVF